MNQQMIISDDNDIYLYFEMVKRTKPQTILDIGMFLQRIGSVSRQAMNCSVPERVYLTGISVDETIFPCMKQVYDSIYPLEKIDEITWMNKGDESFDLTFFLHVNEYIYGDRHVLWNWIIKHSQLTVSDGNDKEFERYVRRTTECEDVLIDGVRYILVHGGMGKKIIVPNSLKKNEKKSIDKQDIRIYVASHKKFKAPEDNMYIPLHVGSAGKASLGYICDDTGENISEKNANYCELTGIYWMWKNVKCDIIGLCHYRRYFTIDGKILERKDVDMLMSDYDVITGNGSMTDTENVRLHYAVRHNIFDLIACRNAIIKLCPEYTEAFEMMAGCNLMTIGNMIICSKDIFDRYCEWLFPILKEAEMDISGRIGSYDDYQRRVYGFLSERLMKVWLLKQDYKVREVQISQFQL